MFINPFPNRRGPIDQTLFPNPNFHVFPNTRPKISLQEYVVGMKYTIQKLLTAGWEDFLKIQRH